jgi:hypothetical protein
VPQNNHGTVLMVSDRSDVHKGGPAVLRAHRPSGMLDTFYASTCEMRDSRVIAHGHWDGGRSGLYSWPSSRVIQIKWDA